MTSTEIRNSYEEFKRMMAEFDQRVPKLKTQEDLAKFSAQYQSCCSQKQLELQVEIASALSELTLGVGIAAAKLAEIARILALNAENQ